VTAPVIRANRLERHFGSVRAVDGIDLEVAEGAIVGLIGPNGAGKTTLLRALLGLTRYRGDLEVLGKEPLRHRDRLMEEVCFIADTAILPRWMRVGQLLDYVAGVHPRFDRSLAEKLLADTEVQASRRIGNLSKGMTVQLHLVLVMAIDARLLVLDEPTLGLDILFRRRFFEQILAGYHNSRRTILISTHQVEEVEDILTDVVFMDQGRVLLQQSLAGIAGHYVELLAVGDNIARADEIPHLGRRSVAGGDAFIYRDVQADVLASLGEVRVPSVADLFVAVVTGGGEHE
jgi:ABC-2 type transport system ATP-binding protein